MRCVLRRQVVASVVCLLVAACLDSREGVQIALLAEDEQPMLANGKDTRTFDIEVPGDTGYGKELKVTTTLGIVNPSATDNKRAITLETRGGNPLSFVLYAETQAGDGTVTVTGAGGLKDTHDFRIVALDGEIELTGPESASAEDRFVELELSLGADHDERRAVYLTASDGILSPTASGEGKLKRTVSLTRVKPLHLVWQPGSAGISIITAGLTEEASDADFRIVVESPEASLAASYPPDEYLADGLTTVPISVSSEGGNQPTVVTLQSDGGLFANGQRSIDVQLSRDSTLSVPLTVGTEVGTIGVSAVASGSQFATLAIPVKRAFPDLLGLSVSPSSVFTASVRTATVTVDMARDVGSTSADTLVRFTACCASGEADCGLQVPAFESTGTQGTAVATVTLRPTGDAFVNEVGNPPGDDSPIDLYAWVASGGLLNGPTCGELASGAPTGVAVMTKTRFAMRKLAPPPVASTGSTGPL